MWNENKFFEDFKKQSDKIQPNKEFVEKTVEMVDGGSKVVSFRKIRMANTAVAAVLVVAIGVSGIWISKVTKNSGSGDSAVVKQTTFNQDSYAGKDSGEVTGGEDNSGVVVEADDVTEVLKLLDDEEVIATDAAGNPLTEEQRQELETKVKSAKIPDEKELSEISIDDSRIDEYKLIGDYMVIVKMINDQYIVIEK